MTEKKKKSGVLRYVLLVLLILGIGASILVYSYYEKAFAPNVPANLENQYIKIPTNSSYEEVLALLRNGGFIIDENSFEIIAKRMNYKRTTMRSGHFKIEPNWSNYKLIGHLRGGAQTPVKVILNNERLLEDVAGKVAGFIEPDSASLLAYFKDSKFLKESGYTEETLMTTFIPNTYELYWNSSPEKFMARMIKEHDKFWAKNTRKAKAKALDLSPKEVYTLASIVERETLLKSEKPRMAGVYHNRLKIGMPLQADPTSVFARRDFDTPRVTDYHTKFDSPYNTYMYAGLPPGPISMASISSIDGVLNREEHKYLYFCALGDGSGQHAFAKTLSQHNQNARNYRANLHKRGKR